MKTLEQETFTLENFEGPLDFLLHLIQKKELDIYEVSLSRITEQYLERLKAHVYVEGGAEFIGVASLLMWLKSKTLLPKHEQFSSNEEEEMDPRFEIIHQLLDYCQFRDVAKILSARDQHQHAYYTRGGESLNEMQKRVGIEHLSLYDLAALFQDALAKSQTETDTITEEEWRVSDKLAFIRKELKQFTQMAIAKLFTPNLSRIELIVTFLAILELMKLGEVLVLKMGETVMITIPEKREKNG